MPLSGGKLSWNPIDPIKKKTSIGSQLGGHDLETSILDFKVEHKYFQHCNGIAVLKNRSLWT